MPNCSPWVQESLDAVESGLARIMVPGAVVVPKDEMTGFLNYRE